MDRDPSDGIYIEHMLIYMSLFSKRHLYHSTDLYTHFLFYWYLIVCRYRTVLAI